jgi:hypothetical protein
MAVVNQVIHSTDVPNQEPDLEEPVKTEPTQAVQPGGNEPDPQSAEPVQRATSTVPDDHPTKLGRRVSRMEERLTDVFDKLDVLIGKMDRGVPTRMPEYVAPAEHDEIPEHVKETVAAVKKELARDSQRDQEMQQRYATDYIRAVQRGFGESDEELHNAVVKELTETNFRNYKKHTGDPLSDAQINYDLAIGAILKRQRAASKVAPNVRGDKPNAPTDLSSTTRLEGPPVKKIELDEYSRKFLAAVGAKEDEPWVLESLKGMGK